MAHDHLQAVLLPSRPKMVSAYLVCSILPFALFSAAQSASSYAGATVSDVFPPLGATFTEYQAYFPDASQVGNAGPTPSTLSPFLFIVKPHIECATVAGAEPEAIATAPVAAENSNIYPLVAPQTPYGGAGTPFQIIRAWGNLSPWYSVGSGAFGLRAADPQVPAGCDLEQVHLLHRHGARYPTSGSAPSKFAAKVHKAANSSGFSATGPLDFLNSWTYKLGAEILTPFGREQL